MLANLTEFKIEKLHGRRTIDIPFVDNRLVLVGENGAGKSTVANLIFYFLTRQWLRLKEYQFSSLQAVVSGQTVRITHEEVQLLVGRRRSLHDVGVHFRYRRGRQILADLDLDLEELGPIESPHFTRTVESLSEEMEMPQEFVRDFLREQQKAHKIPPKLSQTLQNLRSLDFGQFLYLPTYRRIEQDLKSIFRGVEIEDKVREFRERIRKRKSPTFVELVEFGMEDVEKTISDRMARIKESVRTGLNNLTGTYLREVLRGLDDPETDAAILKTIDPQVFESIFARIDEAILPASDKSLLKARIDNISPGSGYGIGSDDKVIAHFLSKLVALYKQQQDGEMDVRAFVHLCNAYLTGKELIFDDVNYGIYIRQQTSSPLEGEGGDKLELKMLSSGEKQIVSLFSHIYFSGDRNYFVIIDEPELSLSVPWQQRFLPDIINT